MTRAASALVRLLALLAPLVVTSGCLLEWVDYVTKLSQAGTADQEHRVRDLRVLGLEVTPAELRYPLAFLDDEAELAPLPLRAEGFAYDPRGGEVDVTFSLCARPLGGFWEPVVASLGASRCVDAGEVTSADPEVAASLAPTTRTVTAGPPATGGRLADLDFEVRVDGAALRSLLALLPEDRVHLGAFELLLVLRVSRLWLGTPEDEWAVLPLRVAPELGDSADPERLQAFLDEHGAELCDPDAPRDCIDPSLVERADPPPPPSEDGAVCGDGVWEAPEECDPPTPGVCSDECTLENICERTCAFALPPNEPPRVYGFDRVDEVFSGMAARITDHDDAALHDGDVVTLAPGDSLGLQAVIEEQADVSSPSPGGDQPWPEATYFRWYVFGDGEIVAPLAFDGVYRDQGYAGAITYGSSVDTHAPGDREPLVLVVHDDRGGQRVLTLELAFE